MGWGLGFGIFLWFFGPLTVFPIVGRQPLDWSAEQGSALFGSLVGYIIYGFILGTVYAFLDRIWVRLFIQSDPLNREPEGLGLHFLRSIQSGGMAGLVGGLVSMPVMAATGILPQIAGLDTSFGGIRGPVIHLLVTAANSTWLDLATLSVYNYTSLSSTMIGRAKKVGIIPKLDSGLSMSSVREAAQGLF